MRRISTNSWTVLLRFYATAGTSRNTHASSSTEKTTHRKFTRRKNADTFGTLSSFEEKLIPFKVLNRPKRMDDAFGDGGLYDEEFEGNKEEEEIGWTSNFLQMKRKETKELPVITQPLAFEREKRRKAKKRKEFEEEYEKLYGVDRNTAKVIIECARKEFNHYEGMRYPPGNINLVSKYWAKCKYKNDWFTIHAIMRKNPSFNSNEAFSWDENVSLLNSAIIENSRRLGFRTPTVVQHRTFRFFNSDTHLLIAAETGSGKTVAYAAPLLSTLMQTTDRQAKAIVMVPTHALRIQTYQMISKLAEGTTVKIIGETEKWKNENFNTNMAWNILVTTPSLSPEFLNSINIDFIVLDEADMLLDDSFLEDIVRLLKFLKIRYPVTDKYNSGGARLILSTATYPDKLQQILESIVTSERLRCVTTENLHRLMPHVKQTFIRIREMDKEEKLKELLEKGISFPSGQTLIFCKNSRNAYSVSASLKDSNIEHILLTGGRRIEHLFDEIHKIRVIVATDVASRGLDLPHLRHVINYDFPRQISDYVHRCGRIGRAGSLHKCLITSFVRRAWEVKHVNLIELAARRGQPLENVELNDPARLRGVQRNLI